MFTLARNREVLWPVTIQVPHDGGPQPVEVQIRYRLLTRSQVLDIAQQASAQTVDDLLMAHVTGWEGIADESGDALPFSRESLAALLDLLYARVAIEEGLYAASRGAPAKN